MSKVQASFNLDVLHSPIPLFGFLKADVKRVVEDKNSPASPQFVTGQKVNYQESTWLIVQSIQVGNERFVTLTSEDLNKIILLAPVDEIMVHASEHTGLGNSVRWKDIAPPVNTQNAWKRQKLAKGSIGLQFDCVHGAVPIRGIVQSEANFEVKTKKGEPASMQFVVGQMVGYRNADWRVLEATVVGGEKFITLVAPNFERIIPLAVMSELKVRPSEFAGEGEAEEPNPSRKSDRFTTVAKALLAVAAALENK